LHTTYIIIIAVISGHYYIAFVSIDIIYIDEKNLYLDTE